MVGNCDNGRGTGGVDMLLEEQIYRKGEERAD